jgi:hypothetical protein
MLEPMNRHGIALGAGSGAEPACAPGDPLCTDLPDESAPPPPKKRPHPTDAVFLNGRHAPGFGIGETFCPSRPYNCPPRPWEPDPGPRASIRDRLGTGQPVGVGGLACWPRDWQPDPGPAVGVGFHFNVGNLVKGAIHDVGGAAKGIAKGASDVAKGAGAIGKEVGKLAKDSLKVDKFLLEQAQGLVSLIPGVGTAISSAISAGLAELEGGGALVIAIKTAYGAIPIPIGIRTFTDIVLNSALDLAKKGANLGNEVLLSVRAEVGSQLPGGPPRDIGLHIFDTLAHLILGKLRGKPTQAKVAAPPSPAQLTAIQSAAASGQPLPAGVTPVPHTAAAYQPLATQEKAQSTPVTIAVPAGGAGYGPYPDSGAPAGTTAGVGVGTLDRGGGGGRHGSGRGGGYPARYGGRPWGSAWRGGGWGWGGPWWPYVVAQPSELECASWGDPINFPAEIAPALRTTLVGAGGDPVAIRGADGRLYRLSLDAGVPIGGPPGPLITVRPCLAALGVGSADDDVLRMMAVDLLGELRRTGPKQYATRSVKNFAQAWNTASADTQIATDGKYTGETEAALNAALSALAPAHGTAPAAIL